MESRQLAQADVHRARAVGAQEGVFRHPRGDVARRSTLTPIRPILTGPVLKRRPGRAEGILGQTPCDDIVGFAYRIRAMEEVEIAGANRAVLHKRVEIDPRFQYSAPKRTIGMRLRALRVCTRVRISNSSSSVP